LGISAIITDPRSCPHNNVCCNASTLSPVLCWFCVIVFRVTWTVVNLTQCRIP